MGKNHHWVLDAWRSAFQKAGRGTVSRRDVMASAGDPEPQPADKSNPEWRAWRSRRDQSLSNYRAARQLEGFCATPVTTDWAGLESSPEPNLFASGPDELPPGTQIHTALETLKKGPIGIGELYFAVFGRCDDPETMRTWAEKMLRRLRGHGYNARSNRDRVRLSSPGEIPMEEGGYLRPNSRREPGTVFATKKQDAAEREREEKQQAAERSKKVTLPRLRFLEGDD
jgi:hypothetical protein